MHMPLRASRQIVVRLPVPAQQHAKRGRRHRVGVGAFTKRESRGAKLARASAPAPHVAAAACCVRARTLPRSHTRQRESAVAGRPAYYSSSALRCVRPATCVGLVWRPHSAVRPSVRPSSAAPRSYKHTCIRSFRPRECSRGRFVPIVKLLCLVARPPRSCGGEEARGAAQAVGRSGRGTASCRSYSTGACAPKRVVRHFVRCRQQP
jgi:hypothetical protein